MYWVEDNYNSANHTYYEDFAYDYNHCITLIGWDDNKVTAGGTGAWICQNSWGTDWGDNGFFYISYNDDIINTSIGYFKHKENMSDNLYTLYQQDELGATGGYGYGSTSSGVGLVKYIAENNFSLKSIGTYAKSSDTDIMLFVFDDFDGTTLSGYLGSIIDVHCDHPGYYTFDFETPIPIAEGNDFYIKASYTAPETTYPIPIEMYISGYAWNNSSQNTWVSQYGANGTWTKTDDYDLALKVFAQADVSANLLSIQNETCYGSSDGSISIEAWGGVPPYTYEWNTIPTQTGSTIENLTAGAYNCTVSDSEGNSTIYTYTVTSPEPIIINLDSLANCECPGDANGYIDIFSPDNLTANEYFANSVIEATSEANTNPSNNLIGSPDNQSWSSNYTMDSQTIILDYEIPSRINGISIYEKSGSGSITSCSVRNSITQTWENVWTGTSFFVETDSTFIISFPLTSYQVDAIKIISEPSINWGFYPLIDAVSILAPEHCDYLWSTDETTSSISNLSAGNYTVTITRSDGCQQIETYTIEDPAPLFLETITDTTICSGNQFCLNATTNGNLSWYILGSTEPILGNCVDITEDVQYLVFSEDNCSELSDTLNITSTPTPQTPTITQTENTLLSNTSNGNQWYNQDGEIEGAIEDSYLVSEDGIYYTIVTIDECASAPSNEIEVIISNIISNDMNSNIVVFPNPAKDYIYFQNNNKNEYVGFEIINALGEKLIQDQFTDKKQININNLNPGVYIIKFDNNQLIKFTKTDY